MEKVRKILVLCIGIVIYIYVCNITLLPNNIIIFKGEELNFKTFIGIDIRKSKENKAQIIQASKNIGNGENIYTSAGSYEINLDLFGTIPVKEINVNVIDRAKVIPCGDLIGLKMYTSGVLVVGMSEIDGIDNVKYKPYQNSGIKEGDMIVEINNKKITNTDELIKTVNSSNGKSLDIKYVRDEETKTTSMIPIKSINNEYKIGLWVRDATAGVGTLTFYEPSTKNFAALGHGIVDSDTGGIFNIANGELVKSNLVSITKGEKNKPGEIKGFIDSSRSIGQIYKNTNLGVYGNVSNVQNIDSSRNKELDVALRSEIQTGEAEMICELEPGKKEHYKINIEKIYSSNNYDNKSMLIKVTDERILNKTGGIIQGMSGSPIIQNGKFIGAVTNVLVSDPTTGYAIFGDLMIKQMREAG
ncbi:MAG: SpoIVB peptidase [Clostridia bacterium]|nr:SpoIVB peptidase [Clostridia bacterium]